MFLNEIKLALRIGHNKLDAEFLRQEEYACAELIRAGVPSYVVEDKQNDLVKNAVITKVLLDNCTEKQYDQLLLSWQYQLDVLRKHRWPHV